MEFAFNKSYGKLFLSGDFDKMRLIRLATTLSDARFCFYALKIEDCVVDDEILDDYEHVLHNIDFLDLSWKSDARIRTNYDRDKDYQECNQRTDGVLSRLVESKSRLRHIEVVCRHPYEKAEACVPASDSSHSLHSLVWSSLSCAECLRDGDSLRQFCRTLTRLTIEADDLANYLPNLEKLILNSQKLVYLELVPQKWLGGRLRYQEICSLSESICANPIMRELSLIRCSLTDECIPLLINIINNCSNLIKMTISQNPFTMIGISSLLAVLETNETLLSLELDSIDLSKMPSHNGLIEDTSLASDAFEQFLTKNRTLISLSLAHTSLSSGDVHSLARGLQANRSLAHLNLSVALTNPQLKLIVDVLCTNNSLIGLNISSKSKLGHAEVQSLINLVRSKISKICMLNFGLHCEKDAAALVLLALKDNQTLTHLSLASCEIRSKTKMLLNIINANHTLASIHLREHGFTLDDIQQIQRALRQNAISDVLQITFYEN
jgi:hypothetical protein